MPDIYEEIGKRIRDFRASAGGRGVSQEDLARAVGTTANTISRWETATYKPAISDLEKLARYFGVPITAFFRKQVRSHGQPLSSAPRPVSMTVISMKCAYMPCFGGPGAG